MRIKIQNISGSDIFLQNNENSPIYKALFVLKSDDGNLLLKWEEMKVASQFRAQQEASQSFQWCMLQVLFM
jgi:hypothetical protein